MMPTLTEEQKEQLKMARRASMRIEETWSLYAMFLSQDKRPHEALERAQEAVSLWSEWMDANSVEGPDIQMPDFAQQMKEGMRSVADVMREAMPALRLGVPIEGAVGDGQIEAEFLPDTSDAPAAQSGINQKEPMD